jgi:zinc finger protein
MSVETPETLFVDITGDQEPTIIESLCMNCEAQGKTTLLFTRIPFFQEVIVVAFECEECGYKNNELQPAGKLKDQGQNLVLTCIKAEDLNRDVVKSEHCSLKIAELDFEIPAARTKGSLNTIEGHLSNTIDDLSMYQDARRIQDPETAAKVDDFIAKLTKLRDGEAFPFTLELDDPSGNSYIKNPYAPSEDAQMKIKYYNRSLEQMKIMGYNPENTYEEEKKTEEPKDEHITAHRVDFNKPMVVDGYGVKEEALIFATPCHSCGLMGENNMCTVSVPYFKELIIMAFSCDKCGAKSREVKVGGETSEKAKRITLKVNHEDDLRRDLFKSETAIIKVPEIELELTLGDVGGIYTTVEGLVEQIHDHMKDNNPFIGDSAQSELREKLDKFFEQLKNLQNLAHPWTLILDDPMANCFIQNPFHPETDHKVEVEIYDRTWDQNEELGLNDMKTEDYEQKN